LRVYLPAGTIGEWLGKLGEKLKVRITLKGFADKVLRLLKYVLLFITFYFTLKSSELFCKKFDPYYAAVSGFNSDVELWWALIAIGALLIGSIFFRLFWCATSARSEHCRQSSNTRGGSLVQWRSM
jgi:polyferredoxin